MTPRRIVGQYQPWAQYMLISVAGSRRHKLVTIYVMTIAQCCLATHSISNKLLAGHFSVLMPLVKSWHLQCYHVVGIKRSNCCSKDPTPEACELPNAGVATIIGGTLCFSEA